MNNSCYSCEKKQLIQSQKICPECGHVFQGNGWDGIDAHWKSKHTDIMPYSDFWQGLCEDHKMSKSNRWTRSEQLLVLDIYNQLPFGQLHRTNALIVDLANKIGRTPSAVAMKACNFASLDPALSQKGLSGASKSDKEIWAEFSSDAYGLALEIEDVKESNFIDNSFTEQEIPEVETEAVRQVKVRRVQGAFRKAVMVSYEYKCAISGLNQPELLIASHIIPWKDSKERRSDPTNGIALNALYDKAFDRGFMTIDEDYRVVLSKKLKGINALFKIEGNKLNLPSRYYPDQKALEWHREHLFIGG